VEGKLAYVANQGPGLDGKGLQVIDVSDPASPLLVGGYDTAGMDNGGFAWGVAVKGNRVYVADEDAVLRIVASLRNVQFTLRVEDVVDGTPCVIEAIDSGVASTPLFTNPSPSGPFDFVDFDVKEAEHPQKFYRAYQP
jgi:hypothetical protein